MILVSSLLLFFINWPLLLINASNRSTNVLIPISSRNILIDNQNFITSPNIQIKATQRQSGPVTTSPLINHGGSLFTSTSPKDTPLTSIYLIFYGNWPVKVRSRVESFIAGVGKSNYYKRLLKGYYDQVPTLHYAASIGPVDWGRDLYYFGQKINEYDIIPRLVADSINQGPLPLDYQGIYVVLPSADVELEDYCRVYCGFHYYFSNVNSPELALKVIVSPNQSKCPSCSLPPSPSSTTTIAAVRKGKLVADATINTLTHQILGTMTNPLLNAWYAQDGRENTDLCVDVYGKDYTKIGKNYYLLQKSWLFNGRGCSNGNNAAS